MCTNPSASKIDQIAKKFNLVELKFYGTPMEAESLDLDNRQKPILNNTKYRQETGALLYIATITRNIRGNKRTKQEK